MHTIKERTEAKEMKMAGDLVMSRDEWLARKATFRGTLSQASKSHYLTARVCENIGQPVSDEEMSSADNFAEMSTCYMQFCLERDGKKVRPNILVFYRENTNKN